MSLVVANGHLWGESDGVTSQVLSWSHATERTGIMEQQQVQHCMTGDIFSDWVEIDGDGVQAMGQWVEGNDPAKQIFPIENRVLKNVRSIVI